MNRMRTVRGSNVGLFRFCSVGLMTIACAGSPTSPLEVGQLDLGAAYDVFVENGTAYVSNNEGVAILDVRDLQEPREVFTIQENAETGTVAGFHYSGDTLLVFGDRLNVYDVLEPDDL